MTDGEDVRQLERNLRALGHDPGHDMTSTTTGTGRPPPRSRRFQRARGLTRRARWRAATVVFRHGRDADRRGQGAGRPAASRPGAQLADVPRPTATSRSTSTPAGSDRARGRQRDGRAADRRARRAGASPTSARSRPSRAADDQDADPTIDVTIDLRGPRRARHEPRPGAGRRRLRRRAPQGVLAVPVKALLARQGGGYAVEVVEAAAPHRRRSSRACSPTAGSRSTGAGLREGMRVVTAQ